MASVEGSKSDIQIAGIERRSIDYVPLRERHGRVWNLGPLWFMGNAQIATIVVGVLGVVTGGNVGQSLIAIGLGCLFGTFFVAFHSAQGPQLGLPQMIQSRPQFGYVGAILVWIFALVNYAGFNIFNTILGGQALGNVTHTGAKGWYFLVTALALAVAVLGYDYIHVVERWLAATFVVFFGIFTIGMPIAVGLPAGQMSLTPWHWTPFLIQFGVSAGYQLSWAPYVSDYSRYLPPTISVRRTFWWTYVGSAVGAIWLMSLGAFLTGAYPKIADTVSQLRTAGDSIFGGYGAVVLLVAVPGLASVTALNMYGGSLTLISAVDSFRPVKPTRAIRLVTIGAITIFSLVLALISSGHFLAVFEDFLLLLLYLFTPWTAVNLVDYYIVRRGHYAIREIFNPDGIYGRWGWRGILAYAIGFGAMVPFFSTPKFTGPIASSIGGADLSIFVGLPVASLLYWAFARSLDVARETEIARQTDAELEGEALRGERPGEEGALVGEFA